MKLLGENILLAFTSEVLKASLCNVDCIELLESMKRGVPISDLTRGKQNCVEHLRRLLENTNSVSESLFRQELENYIDRFLASFSSSSPSVFDAIFAFSDKMIVRSNNKFCYRYEHTDIWRNFSRYVDEEIVLASAVISDSTNRNSKLQQLDFSYCINCDSAEIRNLLQRDKGTSENHFHLRGSSPYFYISWIYLMNHIDQMEFENRMVKMENESLMNKSRGMVQEQLILLWKKAAAIRLYLYCLCQKKSNVSLIEWISDKMEQEDKYEPLMDDLIKYVFSRNPQKTYDAHLQRKIEACYSFTSSGWRNLEILRSRDFENEAEFIDYAQMHRNVYRHVNTKYYNLQGERNFLCDALRFIRYEHGENHLFVDLFYIYLVIKHRFHQELVQSNNRIGFFNFQEYQNRKDFFIPWSYTTEKSIATDTISSIIDDIKIHKVELRITPENNVANMWRIFRTYEAAINEALIRSSSKNIDMTNFFYTLHFIKFRDEVYSDLICRNDKARRTAVRQAKTIIASCYYNLSSELMSDTHIIDKNSEVKRKCNYSIAERIYGIDACGEEMDCRPEVFGSVFRLLQHYFPFHMDHQIKATYHVAEDNYDVVDALRAIDEAIIFCDLRSGSRLGHATLLGIPAEKYYKKKGNMISMPMQNWLDNVVWLYFFIKENNIFFEGCALLLNYLYGEFAQCFHDIYLHETASKYLEEEFKKWGVNEPCFDITCYFLSWLLRGDEPELYATGFIDKRFYYNDKYLYCNTIDKMKNARNSVEACYLYYLYHFRKSIKEKGAKIVIRSLPDCFIKGVMKAQEKMSELIASMGIGIETNPTSNLFISQIKNYNEHPIFTFYNNDLKCHSHHTQLNISVNTDDKSVFSTNLSNEYTFLLFYLEQEMDENENQIYSRFELLKWLDEIRKMGNEQSFSN